MPPKSPRSSVSSTCAHAAALKSTGRSLAAPKTTGRSIVHTSRTVTSCDRKLLHCCGAKGERRDRFLMTSDRTYGLAINVHPFCEAKSKLQCEAPAGRPQAAKMTRASRKSFTHPLGSGAWLPHPHPSMREAVPQRNGEALAMALVPCADFLPGITAARPSLLPATSQQPVRFQPRSFVK